jgi:type II secretion system protein H
VMVKTPTSATGIWINNPRRTAPPVSAASERARGFTLLEILVVVLIIGITLGMVVLAVRPNPEHRLTEEAQRFAALVKLLDDEAIARSAEMAIEVAPHSYRFLTLTADGWQPYGDDVFKTHELPGTMNLDLSLDGQAIGLDSGEDQTEPRIYVLSSGECTAFEVTFRATDADGTVQVSGDVTCKLAYAH